MKNIYIKSFLAFLPSIPLYIWGVFVVTSDPVHIFGFLSYMYFVLTLLVSPVWYLFWRNRRLKKYANTLISLRRQFGIFTWIFALLHVMKFYEHVLNIYEKFFASSQSIFDFIIMSLSWVEWNVFWMNTMSFWFGMIGMILMLALLFTSNDYSQKIFGAKKWKRIQSIAYPLFLIMVLHIYFVGGWKSVYIYSAIFLTSLKVFCWFDKNYERKWIAQVSSNGYRRFLCPPCWFIYDEELWDEDGWLPPGTKYEDIPDDWVCPVCWAAKRDFIPLDGNYNPEESQDHELAFTVVSKKFLTRDVIELQLYCKRDLEIIPWQFCNLIFESEGENHMRSYSVSLYRDNTLTFLMKLKDWWVAWEILRKIEKGKDIKWIWPFWDFVLQNTTQRKIFIATGTGLSPIYNMMHASWDLEKTLYFGVRNREDLFYLEKLNTIPNLTIHIFLSGEEIDPYNFWRITYSNIECDEEDEIYICWSPWLVEALHGEFQKIQKKNVFVEKFL